MSYEASKYKKAVVYSLPLSSKSNATQSNEYKSLLSTRGWQPSVCGPLSLSFSFSVYVIRSNLTFWEREKCIPQTLSHFGSFFFGVEADFFFFLIICWYFTIQVYCTIIILVSIYQIEKLCRQIKNVDLISWHMRGSNHKFTSLVRKYCTFK